MELKQKEESGIAGASLMDPSLSILLVEDNPGDFVLINELLRLSGIDFSLHHVSTLKETLRVIAQSAFDVILLDLGLPDSLGIETLKKIRIFKIRSAVVVLTGLDDEETALESLREGAQDYLVKNRLSPDIILRGIKYGIERKKIQDLLEKNARLFSLLSSATASINECEDISAIFAGTGLSISKLPERAGTIAVDLSSPPKFHVSGIDYLEPWIDQIKQITGLDLLSPPVSVGDLQKEIIDLFNDGKLHELNDKFHNNSEDRNSGENLTRFNNTPDLNSYAIGFIRGDKLYGGVLIYTQDIIGVDSISIIETISNQASLSLHKKIIERDLKSSENRFRKLNEELELKVKERTRDLEAVNYHLNQELIERHNAENALKQSEARLKELNATKDKFFNIIAHDLKNPFTCLLGSTELLSENIHQMDTERIGKLVQILSDSAKSGYAILQNLLDWSRSQTGLITISPERFDLKTLIDENISDLQFFSAKKDIDIFSGVPEEMYLYADRNMINTVLRNLLANAIKFTHRSGTVKVDALINEAGVTISVKDTGIGIPEEKIGKLFRIDSNYTRPGTSKEQGTGLGLKLCKEFVEMQGGKIWVESVVSKGSEFIFSIPGKQIG